MRSEKIWKPSLLIAGISSAAMALYHFWLPYQWGWESKLSNTPAALSWGLFSINFFFSVLLLGGSIITFIVAFKRTETNTLAYASMLGMGVFWVVNAIYQIIIPFPLPDNLAILRWSLLAFAVLVAFLYLLPLIWALHSKSSKVIGVSMALSGGLLLTGYALLQANSYPTIPSGGLEAEQYKSPLETPSQLEVPRTTQPSQTEVAQQNPKGGANSLSKTSSAAQRASIDQVRAIFTRAQTLYYNAGTPDEFREGPEQLQAAEATLKTLIQSDRNDAMTFYWLGQVQFLLGTYWGSTIDSWGIQPDQGRAQEYFEAAWESAKRAVRIDERLAEAHRLIGEAMMRLLKYKGTFFALSNNGLAKQEAERAIQLDAKNATAQIVLGLWYMNAPAFVGGNLSRATELFTQAIGLARDEHEKFLAHLWLGQALVKHQEMEKAREHFQQALAIYPNSRQAKSLLDHSSK
ncbi:tetratricopeptide repeat protein [Candidatus Acetothermia bacterium]|nr:tetratricopeptide repeat protein [Candidatus Acetothermia bacterium]